MRLSGVFPAIVTPFDGDGEVDTDELERDVNRMVNAGVDGIFACGTTGEGALLSTERKRVVVSAVTRAVAGRVPVIAGIIQPDTRTAIEEADVIAELGVDALAPVAPFYYRVGEPEIISHYQSLADSSSRPIVLYDIPSNTGNPFTDAVYHHLLDHPNVVGVKDSSADFPSFCRRLLAYRHGGNTRVSWFQGHEGLDAAGLLMGADGFVSGLANVTPQLFVALVVAWRDNDRGRMMYLQSIAFQLFELVRTTGTIIPAIKKAMHHLGYGNGRMYVTECELDDEWSPAVAAIIERVYLELSEAGL